MADMQRRRTIAIVMAAAGVVTAQAATDSARLNGVAAFVNDHPITIGQVIDVIGPDLARLRMTARGTELSARRLRLYGEGLTNLIERQLILKVYADERLKNNPSASDADDPATRALDRNVERRVDLFIGDRFKGDRQAFIDALRSERMSMEDWRQRMRERIIVSMMRNREIETRTIVPERDIRAEYEAHRDLYRRPETARLRMIEMSAAAGGKDLAAARARIEAARARIAGGADFSAVAREVSVGPQAAHGGDWGEVKVEDLRHELAEPAHTLPLNAISPVIEADGDFYLLRVEARQPGGPRTFAEVHGEIAKRLQAGIADKLYADWIKRIKKDVHIEIVTADPFEEGK